MSSTDSQKKDALTTVQSIASTQPDSSSFLASPSWRSKLHLRLHRPTPPTVPGKEKWRDATLSDKERWKEWNKAKDREQMKGSTIGAFTEFYKGKGKSGYWLDISE
ncbi:hypothetical protein COCC4DRAFT_126136 [Bipolaris maydis ATCC 48331]|uniref:Uncharacterized protein n=2 Tax=Cochliobolus heterostrophus TaxID=5016 RepID=M2UPB8_COCH5|nr:uncharacterized protein COCC4DRAFT_126136 [Bipolaris maydis ATCC 48331]EMD89778.1 hypothetical protein COCHEDRAFT_1138336 [Bipolaris maydis C5]KAJ5025518.1 hypothetical protein J3E73DRAFT_49992 [Bipolaris maydis]ENI10009.1 hypothetical protein COCC4DRAFT_126136 [Bipolaris maydis ATCC 48331]KAJ6269732.1 hypothetical protein PSV08DRAFT_48048 [Bipolaris maydis]KAJ6280455.1 hypothetical protein J3E71DRAFT_354170 [Bipolaris maydis]